MASYLHRPIPFEHAEAIDRRLSLVLYRNGISFFQGVRGPASGREHTLYSLAIATELVLLAYLIDRGVSDDWCKVHIRHDLRKALAFARLKGLFGIPEGLQALVALLGPYYRRHAIASLAKSAGRSLSLPEAQEAVWHLIEGVGAKIRCRDADGSPAFLQRTDG